MGKQQIISQVTERLSQIGVPCQSGNGADLTIANEFVDAGWHTGVKKISYEASVYLDEQSATAFMWEKTLETGSGFSGGFEGGSSFQSGTTLFRKVKSIQYGPDGKAYEYNLDLGAIPKAVKEAAAQAGWKFKTVLKKAKAQYPEGYRPAPAAGAPSRPVQPAVQTPESPNSGNAQAVQAATGQNFCPQCGQALTAEAGFCGRCGRSLATPPAAPVPTPAVAAAPAASPQAPARKVHKTLAIVAYAVTALILLFLLLVLEVNWLGWLIILSLFILSAALQVSAAKKGCATGFVIWFLTLAIQLVVCLFTAA